jgi:hypothetical protein
MPYYLKDNDAPKWSEGKVLLAMVLGCVVFGAAIFPFLNRAEKERKAREKAEQDAFYMVNCAAAEEKRVADSLYNVYINQ